MERTLFFDSTKVGLQERIEEAIAQRSTQPFGVATNEALGRFSSQQEESQR
jgi:hypothetical protein